MFSSCIFCHASLGVNQSIETFPVGRRLAFDAAKGRLWVVCPRCERWNLTPLEERWEAVEECERRYRDGRRRIATDNVGLARVDDGLELVRVGRPLRPELAAWRYGDQFGRRRRRTAVRIGGAAAAGAAIFVGGPLIGMAYGSVLTLGYLAVNGWAIAQAGRSAVVLPHPEGGRIHILAEHIQTVRLVERPASEGGWGLNIPYGNQLRDDERWYHRAHDQANLIPGHIILSGAPAEMAAGKLLARINGSGATQQRVQEAVGLLESTGEPARYSTEAASRTREWGRELRWGDTGALRFLPVAARLALEMAAHEDSERAAMEGELAELERAWRDAEEIAAIADNLLLPDGVVRRWKALREDSKR
ncbi:MAG: hypothetical protein ACYC2G_14075 [Gemmatimonadaceae bacterium]